MFGYDGDTVTAAAATVMPRHREGRGQEASSHEVKAQSSMVADEYEYQAQRQRDIRSRLELRELEKRSRRGGPLVGRLASHQVFHRLE